MLFRHKNEPQKLQVDLGDLKEQKEPLANFLQTQLKVEVEEEKGKLLVKSEKTTLTDLHHAVKKYVYHKSLNTTQFITLEGSTVKINHFKGHEKKEKEKKSSTHQSMTQSWGL